MNLRIVLRVRILLCVLMSLGLAYVVIRKSKPVVKANSLFRATACAIVRATSLGLSTTDLSRMPSSLESMKNVNNSDHRFICRRWIVVKVSPYDP
jgi:hypothetical protein